MYWQNDGCELPFTEETDFVRERASVSGYKIVIRI